MSDLPFEPAPDYIEPLEGWRVWRVVGRDGHLMLGSVVKPTLWPIGDPLVADCLRRRGLRRLRRSPPHDAPEPECECGIYATRLDRLSPYLDEALPADAMARVFGRVALWGSVVECERGLRASHAYPLELYVPSDAARDPRLGPSMLAHGLRDYDVRVEILATCGGDASAALAGRRG